MWKTHAFILDIFEKEYWISKELAPYITDLTNT